VANKADSPRLDLESGELYRLGIAECCVPREQLMDEAMKMAATTAHRRGIPVVLDPVGAGATPYRNQAVTEIHEAGPPTIIRGNGSEIMSVAGLSVATRGVDSGSSSNDAVDAARKLAAAISGVVCVSGADDHVLDSRGRWITLSNGHPWMTKVTGVGCSATAMIGAFAAVQPDAWRAPAAAMAYLGVVGEWAADRIAASGGGVGAYQMALLDGLQLLTADDFRSRLRLACRS